MNKTEKALRPEEVREEWRQRQKKWRRRWEKQGYVYRRINGHWGWVRRKTWERMKKPRARIHPDE